MSTDEEVTKLAEELRADAYYVEDEYLPTLARYILDNFFRKGTPIEWGDVRVGDTIRAHWTVSEDAISQVSTVTRTSEGWLYASSGPIATSSFSNLCLFLLDRPEPEPTKLADLVEGKVADKDGREWIFDGHNSYRPYSLDSKPGSSDEVARRPWSQVATLTPVEGK